MHAIFIYAQVRGGNAMIHKNNREDAENVAEVFFRRDYHDRGMMKWAGFFLSDHTSALKKEASKKVEKQLPKQAPDEIDELLIDAWQSKRHVHIQLDIVDENDVPEFIEGRVLGYQNTLIVVKQRDKKVTLNLDQIRNINYIDLII